MSMPEWKKILILVVGLLEILIFSGTILGWTSLKLMLKNEGIYDYKCQQANGTSGRLTAAASNSSQSLSSPLVAANQTASVNESTSLALSPATLANISLQLNLTISTGQDDNRKLPAEMANGARGRIGGNSLKRTIVIPFQATSHSLNQSFIYTLLRDSSVVLRSNTSDVELSLFSDTLDQHKDNASTLEQFIHLYMAENLEPAHTADDKCSEQEVTLNLAFSIGSFCMGAAAFIWGFLLEKWGLRVVRLLINAMISLGAFLLCFTSKGNDWLLFPAILIMSLGGVPIRIANMQFSNLYPARRSTIISVYSGAFSASSIIYVIIQHIYEGTSISFFWANFILVFLSLLMIPFTIFILPADRISEDMAATPPKPVKTLDGNHNVKEEEGVESKIGDGDSTGLSSDLFPRRKSVFAISPITLQNYKPVSSPIVERRKNGFVNEAFLDDESYSNGKGAILNRELSPPPPPVELTLKERQVSPSPPVAPPLSISLGSFAYNLHQMWFSWMITYMLLYVGSMSMWTERVTTDRAHQSSFVNLYGLFQVLALVISPLAGLLMDWKLTEANKEPDPMERRVKRIQSGFWPLFITSITLLICVLCHYFDSQEFIYTSIIFITIYRAFLLAVGSAFLRIRFHGDHFNRLLGIMSSVSAVTSLLQIPLFKWERSAQSNVLYVNIFNTVVAFFVMSNPLYLLITPLQRYFLRKEDQQTGKSPASASKS